jgi:O-antigen/teichoic acid export membrane protein
MQLKSNIVSNYLGTAWTSIIGLIFVPFYLKYIGIDGYGLVGFFLMLNASLGILDGGLGAVALRECSRYLAVNLEDKNKIEKLLLAMELLFISLALIFCFLIAISSEMIVDLWLNVKSINRDNTIFALRWMALAIGAQFPLSFYTNCITGLQKQAYLNVINAFVATLRGVGAILILSQFSPTIEAFFAWNALLSFGTLFIYRHYLYSSIKPQTSFRQVALSDFSQVKRFMVGAGIINVMSLMLSQLDKIILSKVLTLQNFGYYSLAWMLGTLVYRLTSPIFNAYYPRLTELRESSFDLMIKAYHQSCLLMAVMTVPISIWLSIFSRDILLLWTHNQEVANAACGALSVLSLGTLCNALMHMPYALQLAHGHTKLAIWQNAFTILIMGPLIWYFATRYNLTFAALPWLLINFSYVIISPFFMHKHLSLPGIKEWYKKCVIQPVIISASILYLTKLIQYNFVTPLQQILLIGTSLILALLANLYFSGLLVYAKIHRSHSNP